jgi:hypothetical protein
METKITRSKLLTTDSTCIECGNIFKVNIEEISRWKDKKIPLPTRCKACRRYKLIENKLKKVTKVCFQILKKIGNSYEYKLQEKPSKRNKTEKSS